MTPEELIEQVVTAYKPVEGQVELEPCSTIWAYTPGSPGRCFCCGLGAVLIRRSTPEEVEAVMASHGENFVEQARIAAERLQLDAYAALGFAVGFDMYENWRLPALVTGERCWNWFMSAIERRPQPPEHPPELKPFVIPWVRAGYTAASRVIKDVE